MTRPSREVAFVFQDYGRALLPWRTVEGNVSLALEAAGVPRGARAAHRRRTGKVGLSHMRASSRCSCRAACSSGRRSRAAWPRSPS
jgi:ABC-type nitrate/sulfonate/bicarbonate transport system ATPase subunit